MNEKILIIEDNHDLAESLVDILEVDNYEIATAMSGQEGLDLAFTMRPDLILLDIRMPDMDGYHVYRRLQTDDWGKTVKVLILTASESIEEISKNVNLPRKYVLFKPDVSIAELRTKITERLAE